MGNKPSAAPATPTVPITVMAFGVIGVRASALPTGVNKRVIAGRSAFSMEVRSYVRLGRSCAGPGGRPLGNPPITGGLPRPVPPGGPSGTRTGAAAAFHLLVTGEILCGGLVDTVLAG
jgi:hypothetical protein